jgi:hypothetical protein
MQLWPGTAFMNTSEIVGVARMFDDAGYQRSAEDIIGRVRS